MKALGILAWIALSSLITAIVTSATMRQIWRWFVADEYGSGPSLGAWFGIATILMLIVRSAGRVGGADNDSFDVTIRKSIAHSFGLWLGCGLVLIMAALTGLALGWVR